MGTTLIKSVRAKGVSAPLTQPHHTASGTITAAHLVLFEIDCGDITGCSYVFTFSPQMLRPMVILAETLTDVLGSEPLEPVLLFDALQARFRIPGTTGMLGTVLGGIDMALWDAFAKAKGEPLVRLLGGAPRPVPIYESMGMLEPDEMARQTEAAKALGVNAFKVKAGHPEPARDVETAGVLRQAAGEAADIMFDYNQAFTPIEAIRRLELVEEYRLTWIEEPVAADDLDGHAAIRSAVRVPVQLGENWWSPAAMKRAFMAEACDYAMIDAMRIGGVTGWLRAAAIAEAHGVPLSTHFFPEVSVHLMCVTPTAHLIEWLDVSSTIMAEPLEIADGCVSPSGGPGIGVTFDKVAVEKWRVA
jgi:mandelate racemase